MKAHSRALKAHRELQRFMYTGAIEAHLGVVEAHPGAVKAQSGIVEAHTGALEACVQL
jgi:hypothetical protein